MQAKMDLLYTGLVLARQLYVEWGLTPEFDMHEEHHELYQDLLAIYNDGVKTMTIITGCRIAIDMHKGPERSHHAGQFLLQPMANNLPGSLKKVLTEIKAE